MFNSTHMCCFFFILLNNFKVIILAAIIIDFVILHFWLLLVILFREIIITKANLAFFRKYHFCMQVSFISVRIFHWLKKYKFLSPNQREWRWGTHQYKLFLLSVNKRVNCTLLEIHFCLQTSKNKDVYSEKTVVM